MDRIAHETLDSTRSAALAALLSVEAYLDVQDGTVDSDRMRVHQQTPLDVLFYGAVVALTLLCARRDADLDDLVAGLRANADVEDLGDVIEALELFTEAECDDTPQGDPARVVRRTLILLVSYMEVSAEMEGRTVRELLAEVRQTAVRASADSIDGKVVVTFPLASSC